MRRILVERRLDDRRLNALAADLDLEPRTLLGRVRRQIARSNRDGERGAHGAAAHQTTRPASGKHRVSVSRDVAIAEREPDELSRNAFGFLALECRFADEVALL